MQMQQQAAQQAAPAPAAGAWKCTCGAENTGKFCMECGKPKPEEAWKCPQCGTENRSKFCSECGAKKPPACTSAASAAGSRKTRLIRRNSAPECGDPFNEADLK